MTRFFGRYTQHQGRLFTLIVEEAVQSEDLIRGKCEVKSKTLIMLYDLGATYSFISLDCVTKLKLYAYELPYDLLVSTPINKLVRTSQVCTKLLFQINGRTFVVDLICLPLSGLDIILGMDWLSANRVMLNCSDKTILFPSTSSFESVIPISLYLSSLSIDYCGTEV